MAKKDNKLKSVNLEDLRSSDPFEELDNQMEEIVEVGVSIDELDKFQSNNPSKKNNSNSITGKLFDPSLEKRQNSSKELLDKHQERRVFDRKIWNLQPIIIAFTILLVGFLSSESQVVSEYANKDLNLSGGAAWMVKSIFSLLRFIGKTYLYISGGILVFGKLKKPSHKEFIISYDGIVGPMEVENPKTPKKRARWSQIKDLVFEKRGGQFVACLKGDSGSTLIELSLDIERPEELKTAIERLSPKDHPIRKLVNN